MKVLSVADIRRRADVLDRLLRPPPRENIAQWTDLFRRTEEGKFYVATAPYQRGVMEALSNPHVEEVIMMTSAQVGKTEIILNTIGRYMHRDPCAIMWILPKLEMAKDISKSRLDTMFDVTPVLQGLLPDRRTRDAKNSMTFKKFPGGFLLLSGANSPASLSSWPIRILLGDEIDRWGKLIRGEGDILMLARKRTTKYATTKKIFLVSTPTEKGESRIAPAFEETNQQFYHVPCSQCNGMQVLRFENLKFEYDQEAIRGLTASAAGEEEFDWKRKAISDHIHAWFVCEHCGAVMEHEDKHDMILAGEWRARFPKIVKRQGFHIWQAYSPFVTWAETVAEFLYATGYPDRMRVFTNTVLGELWEDKGDRLADVPLMNRREQYPDKLPQKIEVVTAGVDVQGDRLECEIIAWAADGENWSLEYHVYYGNTKLEKTYDQLEELLGMTWVREDGAILPVDAMGIDTGYNPRDKKNTQDVDSNVIYDWVEKISKIYRVFGVKGAATRLESAVKWTRAGTRRLRLLLVDGDQIKDVVLERLRIDPGLPGSAHFPLSYEKPYFLMLTAEEKRRKAGRREWVKVRERNEAVDTRQYAYAALVALKPKWGHIKRRRVEEEKPAWAADGSRPAGEELEAATRKPRLGVRRRRRAWRR